MKKKFIFKKNYIVILCCLFGFIFSLLLLGYEINSSKEDKLNLEIAMYDETTTTKATTTTTAVKEIVWDNLTEEELTNKLNKNLYSTLSGTGSYFAKYTKETGLDPYLAVSIVNLETGCKWGCSSLVKKCNNIGGIKGKPSCNGSAYRSYSSLDEGIKGYLDLVYYNYYSKGLDTPEKMNPKYAESKTWAQKVNAYYETIKSS